MSNRAANTVSSGESDVFKNEGFDIYSETRPESRGNFPPKENYLNNYIGWNGDFGELIDQFLKKRN